MQLKDEEDDDQDMGEMEEMEAVKQEAVARVSALRGDSGTPTGQKRQGQSPVKRSNGTESPAVRFEEEDTIGGDVSVKLEDGKPPKLARSTSHKVERRQPQLFFDYADSTKEACASFDKLTECTYANKHLGTTEHALECDCSEEWGKQFLHDLDCHRGRASSWSNF